MSDMLSQNFKRLTEKKLSPDEIRQRIGNLENMNSGILDLYASYQNVAGIYNEAYRMFAGNFLPGHEYIHEYLAFDHKPENDLLIASIQDYFGSILMYRIKSLDGYILNWFDRYPDETFRKPILDLKITLKLTTADGEELTFTCDDMPKLLFAILEELPVAKRFSLDMYLDCHDLLNIGVTRFDLETRLYDLCRVENFLYKKFYDLGNHGEMNLFMIKDGNPVDIEEMYHDGIIGELPETTPWETYNVSLWFRFDRNKYPEMVHQFRSLVQSAYKMEELNNTDELWEEEDEENYDYCLLSLSDVNPDQRLQTLLDRISDLFAPLGDQISYQIDGSWHCAKESMAVATIAEKDHRLKIVGTTI